MSQGTNMAMSGSLISVTILGSTGTIGVNTLDVISRHSDRFKVIALTANNNVAKLLEQCQQWHPQYAVMVDEKAAEELEKSLRQIGQCGQNGSEIEVLSGTSGLEFVASMASTDYVMAGIVGAAGLLPTLAAARAGKRVMLANKEALVMSGQLFMDAIKENGAELLPIDSEHNAIFQAMPKDYERGLAKTGVKKILLTASGGPFRTTPLAELKTVTPAQAVAHPNWVMGRKISVDSATMMNKGLEIIEACWLFHTDTDHIQVVIHPQSVIHSLVQYNDGSVIAQLGNPDMRTPIAYALGWPERIDAGVEQLDLFDVAQLDFELPDRERFPCLRLAEEAMAAGGTATTVLNAANEIAVAAFLDEGLKFSDIPVVIEETLSNTANMSSQSADTLQSIQEADSLARQRAQDIINRLG